MTIIRMLRTALLTVIIAIVALAAVAMPASAAPRPTVVLVHGAFADPTSWDRVAAQLRGQGYRVLAPENPLRGPAHDAAAIQRTLDTVAGPIVLVGHSYGGFVISNVHDSDVVSMVYVAAFAPAQGEIAQLALNPIQYPGSQLLPPALQVKVVDDPQGIAGRNLDGYVAPEYFHDVFAQDVDDATAADMLAHQQSIALAANLEPSGAPSWAGKPSWFLVSQHDRVIPPASQRFMAERMGAQTTELDASHASLVSRPGDVTAVIETAAG
ncbi:alpha/beta fold hydrolase [Nocardia jinanensis]|uniref:Alpha/beta hydrolase n=1 Tax=Nocardia jinanensis TaxID=382504 RepID=A0A917RUR2_9NOCA|nr:alpha/beta hydrolase [Nocardia jinanensis]GGL35777.1 alpha/beta hydrolase [Nocardia jinanensis]